MYAKKEMALIGISNICVCSSPTSTLFQVDSKDNTEKVGGLRMT